MVFAANVSTFVPEAMVHADTGENGDALGRSKDRLLLELVWLPTRPSMVTLGLQSKPVYFVFLRSGAVVAKVTDIVFASQGYGEFCAIDDR
jgi:hypothetical protein